MHKSSRLAARAAIILVCLTALFCGLLYVAGLGGERVQSLVEQNIESSIPQFNREGSYPQILNSNNRFFSLDNFTETTILQEALFMNTTANPLSIFENPRVNLKDVPEGTDAKVASLIAAVNGEKSNSKYNYYWMGFRAAVRPLLILMNYQQIRHLLSIGFYLLLAAACFTIYRHANLAVSAVFLLSVLGINIAIASIELQFACCFYLMFIAIILLPYIKKTRLRQAEFFLIVGACTMYFDFYTTPLITLGAPLLFLLASRDLQDEGQSGLRTVLQCALFWLLGYGAAWLIRLLLVTMLTSENAIASAFEKFGIWTGIKPDSRYEKYSVYGAFKRCLLGIINRPNIMLYFITVITTFVLYVKRGIRRSLQRPRFLYLLIAALPLVWIAVSYRAASAHYWFQYRSLVIMIFGGLLFLISPLLPEKKQEITNTMEEGAQIVTGSTTPSNA